MTVRPWREIARLKVDLNAARGSASASARQANRFKARIVVLEAKCVKRKRQGDSDHSYIARLHEIIVDLGGADRLSALEDELRDQDRRPR